MKDGDLIQKHTYAYYYADGAYNGFSIGNWRGESIFETWKERLQGKLNYIRAKFYDSDSYDFYNEREEKMKELVLKKKMFV